MTMNSEHEQPPQQFIITSLSQKSYINIYPHTTLADVRSSILSTWDNFQYPQSFNFRIDELIISTKQEVDHLACDILNRGSNVELFPRPEERKRRRIRSEDEENENSTRSINNDDDSSTHEDTLSTTKQDANNNITQAAQSFISFSKSYVEPRSKRGTPFKSNPSDVVRVLDFWKEYSRTPKASKSQFCKLINASDDFQSTNFCSKTLLKWLEKEDEFRMAAKNEQHYDDTCSANNDNDSPPNDETVAATKEETNTNNTPTKRSFSNFLQTMEGHPQKQSRPNKWTPVDIVRVIDLWREFSSQMPTASKMKFARLIIASDDFEQTNFCPSQLRRWMEREDEFRMAAQREREFMTNED